MIHDDIAAVLAGTRRHACIQSKAEEFFAPLPDNSIDLIITSPPYLKARMYGELEFAMNAEEWTAWMLGIVKAASPKCKGLIAINCEGQTEDFAYQPAPFLLIADLYRAGFVQRKPIAFHRVGIPGSGGREWLRNDWEPVICVTRGGALPFADNTACGHPPKWAPGGEFSHRKSNGTRVNQWGGNRTLTGDRDNKPRPSHKKNAMGVQTDRPVGSRPETGTAKDAETETYRARTGNFGNAADGSVKGEHDRDIVDIANPGNTVQRLYTADEVASMFDDAGDLIHYPVGGNLMGHPLAHENEAPFPVRFAEFFVQSFCPPDGVVADCFSGSSTVSHACMNHGRRFIGCDARASQVDLHQRRMSSVTPTLFG